MTHGHVKPRADGVKARCGGPAICSQCAREQAAYDIERRQKERDEETWGPSFNLNPPPSPSPLSTFATAAPPRAELDPPAPAFRYAAFVTRVIDGDTVEATVDLGFHLSAALHLRLLGIDAPELHAEKLSERAKAVSSSAYLSSLVLGKTVVIETRKTDSFGRWLATIWTSAGMNVNKELLAKGYAAPRGGK